MSTESIEPLVADLSRALDDTQPSGVAVVYVGPKPVLEYAGGLADRANRRAMTTSTRLATASGTKGFTALAAASLIEDGLLGLDTRLVELTADLLPHVDARVTIEHLLGHTSGVGDYLDEEQLGDIDDYVLDVAVHRLVGPTEYLPLLNRYEQVDAPGSRFAYNNSGYVMLALAIERASGQPYHDLVRHRVFEPAGMAATGFDRSDGLGPDTALGYLADGRTNVLHLPVIGTGDGGAYTTAADMMRFWAALLSGRIVGESLVRAMTAARSRSAEGRHYGLGFWIGANGQTIELEGMDAGVSLRSGADPVSGLRYCFIANNSADVWPLARIVDRYNSPQP